MAKGDLEVLATFLGIGASIVTIVGFFKRITCPCDGSSLSLAGDRSLLGTRYCKNCGHNH
ncbi:MAG: hypothetical protein ACHQ03_10475 [Candidatus Bathyarchaeia archaeon]